MAVMTPDDWASYRQQAAQQTANMNAAPFVLDPSKLTGDPAANRTLLYANAGGSTGDDLKSAITGAFQSVYGRSPTDQDMAVWLSNAQKQGLSAQAVAEGIANSALDPRNAQFAANKSTGQAAFTGGLMSSGGGNALAGGGFMGVGYSGGGA